MNKKTKGWIAAGLGGALLLGTGGTFALWHDTANLDEASIETGDLALGEAEVLWRWEKVSYPTTEIVLGATPVDEEHTLSPGDQIKGTVNFGDIVLRGTTLVAELRVAGLNAAEVAPPFYLDVQVDGVSVDDLNEIVIADNLTSENLTLPSVTVTLGFAADGTSDEPVHHPVGEWGGPYELISIGDVTLHLEQQTHAGAFRAPSATSPEGQG